MRRHLAWTFLTTFIIFTLPTAAQMPSTSTLPHDQISVERDAKVVTEIIARAESHFKQGEQNLVDNNPAAARSEFDKAVDMLLESGMDVSANSRLQTYYLQLVERIYSIEKTLTAKSPTSSHQINLLREQKFEPSPLDEFSRPVPFSDEARAQSKEACAQAQLEKLSLRGLHLGMRLEDVRAHIPTFKMTLANRFGFSRTLVLIKVQHVLAQQPDFKGLAAIYLDFFDGRVSGIATYYDNSTTWRTANEFVGRISQALKLPDIWEPYEAEQAGGTLNFMTCGSIDLIAGLTTVSYQTVPLILLKDNEFRRSKLRGIRRG